MRIWTTFVIAGVYIVKLIETLLNLSLIDSTPDMGDSSVTAASPIWTSEGCVEMPLQQIEIDAAPKTTPFERAFNPYDFNGG